MLLIKCMISFFRRMTFIASISLTYCSIRDSYNILFVKCSKILQSDISFSRSAYNILANFFKNLPNIFLIFFSYLIFIFSNDVSIYFRLNLNYISFFQSQERGLINYYRLLPRLNRMLSCFLFLVSLILPAFELVSPISKNGFSFTLLLNFILFIPKTIFESSFYDFIK